MRVIQGGGGSVEAASANIIVVDNNQVVNIDQSSSMATITKTSEVVVRNSSATSGYVLSAKLLSTTSDIPDSTVTISSPSSLLCLPEDPCILTDTTQPIGRPVTTEATNTTLGHTTVWTVAITVPANTDLGNYLVDIEYSEEAILDLTTISTMQAVTQTLCDNSIGGLTVSLRDTRDNKSYRVRKMVDGRCWMVENLAYDIGTAAGRPAYSPAAQLVSGTMPSTTTRSQYTANTGFNTSAGEVTYLYNWCAALGDTSTDCAASVSADQYDTVINGALNTAGTATEQLNSTGICPAPFRLPKGGPEANPANDGTNTAAALASTANEFVKLDIAIGGTGKNRDSVEATGILDLYAGNAAVGNNWSAMFAGYYNSGRFLPGILSESWSSTASSTTGGYRLSIRLDPVNVYPANDHTSSKHYGFAVRCLF